MSLRPPYAWPDADRDHANGVFIEGGEAYPALWAARAAEFRARHESAELGVAYGPRAAEKMDIFWPEAAPLGMMIFIHGGYWLASGREDWSHLAKGALARGWAVTMPSYPLAPEARISEMTKSIEAALHTVAGRFSGPIVATGHSAGGHLAARLGNQDFSHLGLKRVVAISPLAELGPLLATTMNQTLRLDTAEVALESPARLPRAAEISAHVWVGMEERPSFLWQARLLSEEWACPWTPESGRHHYNVIEGLEFPQSRLMDCILAL